VKFLTIIELPKTAYRVVKTPTAGERLLSLLTWGLTQILLALIVLGSDLSRFKQKWAARMRDLTAYYRLAGVIAGIFVAVALEDALFAFFSRALPAIPAA